MNVTDDEKHSSLIQCEINYDAKNLSYVCKMFLWYKTFLDMFL
jgi:hypothetical protein